MRARIAVMQRIAWLIPAALMVAPVAHRAAVAQAQSTSRVVAPICVGQCPRVVGFRITWRDSAVQRVDGVNVTMWTPREEGYGKTHGLSLGLPMASTGNLDGIALGVLAGQTTDRLRGVGVAGVAIGADRVRGTLSGGVLALAGDVRGFAISPGVALATNEARGAVLGGLGAFSGGGWGVTVGGLGAFVGGGYRGLATGGIALFSGSATGIAAAGGMHKAADFRGISIALINHAKALRGLQIGAINIVADGRSPRILPILNWR